MSCCYSRDSACWVYEEVMSHYANIVLENELMLLSIFNIIFPNSGFPKSTFVSGFASICIWMIYDCDWPSYYLPFEHRFQPPDLPQYISIDIKGIYRPNDRHGHFFQIQ